jgi:hypothetical protein
MTTAYLTRPPQTGCYGVVDLSGWFPWCIRHLTRSPWAHAFIVLDDAAGTILEARPSGSAIGNLNQYAGRVMLFSEPAPEAGKAGGASSLILQARESWTGIEYGFADIAELGLWYSLHVRPEWLTKLVLSEQTMICSQLVAEWGSTYGADWNCGQADPQFVTPGLLGARLTG